MTHPDPAPPLRVGIDIGGTSIRATGFDQGDAELATIQVPTPDPGSLAACCAELVGGLLTTTGADRTAAVGIGIPGRVRPDAGLVSDAVNLGIGSEGLDLAARLTGLLDPRVRPPRPVHLENDVNAATVGCAHLVGHRPDRVLAYLSVGTGLKAGLMVGPRLLRGATGLAGEIGHLPLDPDGPVCACGQTGCLEAVASGGAMTRHWPPGVPGETAADLARAAAAGHPAADDLWTAVTRGLAWAVQLLTMTVEPDSIVLGGGLVDAGDVLLDAVLGRLGEITAKAPLLEEARLGRRLQLLPADRRPGSLGAVLAAERWLPPGAPS